MRHFILATVNFFQTSCRYRADSLTKAYKTEIILLNNRF